MLTPVLSKPGTTTEMHSPTLRGRIPALDGLRGVAILLVLLHHGPLQIHASSKLASRLLIVGNLSFSGVDLFFVLSGFLIGGILMDTKKSPHYFTTFYVRRAYRILPLYLLVLAIYSFWYVPEYLHAMVGAVTIPLAAYATFTQNFWMAYLGAFGGVSLGVTWSLAVEEQFYLTAPLIVRSLTRERLAYLLAAIVVLSPLLRTLLLLGFHSHNVAAYVLMPCRADALCLGVLCALIWRDPHSMGILARKRALLIWIMIGLLVAVVSLAYGGWTLLSVPMATFGYSILAFFYTGCLLIALIKMPFVERLLCNGWLTELGGISYCVYLIHRTVIRATTQLLGASLQRVGVHLHFAQATTITLGSLLGIGVSLVVAKLSWRFFEQPLLRRGHAYPTRKFREVRSAQIGGVKSLLPISQVFRLNRPSLATAKDSKQS